MPCITQNTSVFCNGAMHVDHIDSYSAGLLSISNFPGAVLPRFWDSQGIKLNMHPNRRFPAHFVVHMSSCLHILFRVVCPLHSNPPSPPCASTALSKHRDPV